MNKRKNVWRWWAKALGEKPSKCDKESDRIAIIRTLIFTTYLITNCFIIAGVIRHWNKNEVPSHLHKEQEKITIKTNCDFL
jgi:hypothetical protein